MAKPKESKDDSPDNSAKPGIRGVLRHKSMRILLTLVVCLLVADVAYFIVLPRLKEARRNALLDELVEGVGPDAEPLIREAGEVALDAIDRYPASAEAHNVMAQVYYRLRELEGAVEYWEKCLELNPDFEPAYQAIGIAALESGDHAKAEQYFRTAAERAPHSSIFPVQLAEELIKQGKLDEAVEVLDENLRRHPKSLPSFALLGQAHFQLKNYEEARKCLEAAIQIGPDYTNAYYTLSRTCAKLGETEKSQEYLAKFKSLKDRDEQGHRSDLKARDDLINMREIVAQSYTDAANVYMVYGDPDTAEAHLLKAAEFAPLHLPSRRMIAWIYQKQGRDEDLLRVLAELSEIGSSDAETLLAVGEYYGHLDRFDDAVNAYRGAIRLTPLQSGGYAILADLCMWKGRNLEEARELADRAVELEPVARNYFLLGTVCRRLGDVRSASTALARAAELEPENADYRKALELIRQEGIR